MSYCWFGSFSLSRHHLFLRFFLTETNLRNILNQSSVLGILACAQFLVVVIGGFDLSVAAVLALASVIFATLAPTAPLVGALLAIAAGALLGLLSGVAVTLGRVTPMIATLGVMGIARGFAFVVAEKSVSVPPALLEPFKAANLAVQRTGDRLAGAGGRLCLGTGPNTFWS